MMHYTIYDCYQPSTPLEDLVYTGNVFFNKKKGEKKTGAYGPVKRTDLKILKLYVQPATHDFPSTNIVLVFNVT